MHNDGNTKHTRHREQRRILRNSPREKPPAHRLVTYSYGLLKINVSINDKNISPCILKIYHREQGFYSKNLIARGITRHDAQCYM
jgi:hypothetical protein